MPLRVVIIGAGIAGLALAIALRRHGHTVTIYERRSASKREDSGSGVTFQANVASILAEWNLLDDLREVAHVSEFVTVMSANEEIITRFDCRHRGQLWYGLRSVLKDLFRKHAIQAGARVFEGTNVEQIDARKPEILLHDGTRMTADLVIGADGTGSKVRQTLFPVHKPTVLGSATIQVVLPLDLVQSDPLLNTLLDEDYNTVLSSPGRSIFASPAPHQGVYDMQFTDSEYTFQQDPNPQLLNERWNDLTWLKQRWSDHGPAIRKAIDHGKSAFKWRFTEINDLPSWSSPNGRVVLVGDSKHGMTPHAGHGSGMGVEDAAILAELLRDATPKSDFVTLMQQYESIRRPRCERMKDLTRAMGHAWFLRGSKQIEQRNSMWRRAADPENLVARYQAATPDINARFGTPSFERWVDEYDVRKEVQKAKARAKL